MSRPIHVVFTSTPNGRFELRDVVVETLIAHPLLLLEDEVDTVMNELHSLCYRFIKEQARKNLRTATVVLLRVG